MPSCRQGSSILIEGKEAARPITDSVTHTASKNSESERATDRTTHSRWEWTQDSDRVHLHRSRENQRQPDHNHGQETKSTADTTHAMPVVDGRGCAKISKCVPEAGARPEDTSVWTSQRDSWRS